MSNKDELVGTIKEHIRKRNEAKDAKFLFGAERVDLRRVDHLKFEARKKHFTFLVDEPADRGGTDEAPNPLAYFMAGAASCLLNQYATLAISKDIPLTDLELTARGHFNRILGGAFEEMVYDIRLSSTATTDEILSLSKEAERMCYAHNTLKKARVKMVTNLFQNGKQVS
ncbi:MAG: OsmC family protein [Nitrososphaerales archaeon]|nr:OsmC family protein [Nitrososphaerales archaeon]